MSLGEFLSWYLLSVCAAVLPVKYLAKRFMRTSKEDHGGEYDDLVAQMGEHTLYVFFWWFYSVAWPVALFRLTLELIRKFEKTP